MAELVQRDATLLMRMLLHAGLWGASMSEWSLGIICVDVGGLTTQSKSCGLGSAICPGADQSQKHGQYGQSDPLPLSAREPWTVSIAHWHILFELKSQKRRRLICWPERECFHKCKFIFLQSKPPWCLDERASNESLQGHGVTSPESD